MKIKLRVNRVSNGHRQRRGRVYDVLIAEARPLLDSGRAEAMEEEPVKPRKRKSKESEA